MSLLKVAIIFVACFWIYSPVYHGEWLWDDDYLLTNNTEMRQNNSHPVGPKLKQNPSDRAMNLNTEAQLLCPSAESAGPEAGRNDHESLQLTDNVSELCRFICSICHKTVGSLRCHIKCHMLKLDQYKAMYPEIKYQRKTHHRYCTWCNTASNQVDSPCEQIQSSLYI